MVPTIVCPVCKVTFDFNYEDDGSTDCMPDGFIIEGVWICDDCYREEEEED